MCCLHTANRKTNFLWWKKTIPDTNETTNQIENLTSVFVLDQSNFRIFWTNDFRVVTTVYSEIWVHKTTTQNKSGISLVHWLLHLFVSDIVVFSCDQNGLGHITCTYMYAANGLVRPQHTQWWSIMLRVKLVSCIRRQTLILICLLGR